jgi:hypothetical protein
MRRLRPLCALILIVWGLLLSTARNTPAESPSPPLSPEAKSASPTQPKPDTYHQPDEGHPPQVSYSPFEAAFLKTLSALTDEQKAKDREEQAAEQRWWPPTAPWAVVYVTVAYVIVAAFQLSAIRRQAKIANDTLLEARKAADAATMNARAAIEGQRAHIFGGPQPIVDFGIGKEPKPRLALKNVGLTPAYNCIAETWVEVLQKPFIDFSPNAFFQAKPDPFVLYQNAPAPMIILLRWNRPLTEQEVSDIEADKWGLCFRVRLKYRDAFRGDRVQNFGFSSNSVTFEPLPKYND